MTLSLGPSLPPWGSSKPRNLLEAKKQDNFTLWQEGSQKNKTKHPFLSIRSRGTGVSIVYNGPPPQKKSPHQYGFHTFQIPSSALTQSSAPSHFEAPVAASLPAPSPTASLFHRDMIDGRT